MSKQLKAPDAAWFHQPIRRPLCPDEKPMTPARIVAITTARGYFEVAPHYREENVGRACRMLRLAGYLIPRRKLQPAWTCYGLASDAPPVPPSPKQREGGAA